MKSIIRRIGNMSRPAKIALKLGIVSSYVYLLAAIVVLLMPVEGFLDTYKNLSIAGQLFSAPQGVLILVSLASVIIEDYATK